MIVEIVDLSMCFLLDFLERGGWDPSLFLLLFISDDFAKSLILGGAAGGLAHPLL